MGEASGSPWVGKWERRGHEVGKASGASVDARRTPIRPRMEREPVRSRVVIEPGENS